jgi:hypothetical protein
MTIACCANDQARHLIRHVVGFERFCNDLRNAVPGLSHAVKRYISPATGGRLAAAILEVTRQPRSCVGCRFAAPGQAIYPVQGVREAEPSIITRTSSAASASVMPTAVTYSGRLAMPRTGGIACTADAKRVLATPMTETPNSSWAYAPRPGLPPGSRVT